MPAPGLPVLLDRLETNLRNVSEVSDRIAILLRDPEPTAELLKRIAMETGAAEQGADEAECACRRIAQLAFGVTSGMGPSERAERLDRAAVAVLHPPVGTGRPVGLVNDGIQHFGHHVPELPVELRGIICRMIIDRNVIVRFDEIELELAPDEDLHLTTSSGHEVWSSPMQVSEPAHAVADVLT